MPGLIRFFARQSERLQRYWQDLPLTGKGIVLNALPLTVLLASLALIFKSEQQSALLETRVQNALQIQQDIQTLQTQLLEASTGVRDFLLTGNPQFLGGYQRAERAMPKLLSALEAKLDDHSQHRLLAVIHPLVQKNLEDLRSLASNNAHEANELLIRKFLSQSDALNQLREDLQDMSDREADLVTRDKQDVLRERQRNFHITLLAVLAGVLGSLLGVWIFSNTIAARVKTIRDSAIHLVKGEPLALPRISRDELGQLTEELDHASQLLAQSTQAAHQARVEAEEASEAKSMFLSRTSHELRTPLNAILGFAQILENDLAEGRQKDSATLIHNAGQHLLKLINEVLDISRIESGDIALSMEVMALQPILEEAAHYLKPLGDIRDMQIETSFATHLYVRADRQRLLQVILNLLANALKYGPANTRVQFQAAQVEDQVNITILDQGTGIPAALRSRLFTPFDRLGAERTMTEGTGLGLVLSKQLMDAMGGSIGVDETQSLFWLRLPACVAPATSLQPPVATNDADASTPRAASTGKAQKSHVLYVEDQASNRALMDTILARHRHLKLHLACNLQEGMLWLADMRPDLLLIDLNLPDGSGENLIRYVKSQPHLQQIPVIVLSADALPATMARVEALPVSHYFTKPLNVAAFNRQIMQLLPEPGL